MLLRSNGSITTCYCSSNWSISTHYLGRKQVVMGSLLRITDPPNLQMLSSQGSFHRYNHWRSKGSCSTFVKLAKAARADAVNTPLLLVQWQTNFPHLYLAPSLFLSQAHAPPPSIFVSLVRT